LTQYVPTSTGALVASVSEVVLVPWGGVGAQFAATMEAEPARAYTQLVETFNAGAVEVTVAPLPTATPTRPPTDPRTYTPTVQRQSPPPASDRQNWPEELLFASLQADAASTPAAGLAILLATVLAVLFM